MQSTITADNFILVLGTVQDGGYPHIGCYEECCNVVKGNPKLKRMVSSIAIIDKIKSKVWLIDASPDINSQLNIIANKIENFQFPYLSGVFLTHAHTGHYSGLLNLGLEGLNIKNVPIYAMPKMKNFLMQNSMFSQLLDNNIILEDIKENFSIKLNDQIEIKAFNVPHRNELSETVGYKIISNEKSIVYIPDIDSWNEWDTNILDVVDNNDILLIDGTFYTRKEIKKRSIDKIPHPPIEDSMKILDSLNEKDKNKIFFTHLNHTNKVLNVNSKEYEKVVNSGYNILNDKQIFNL